MIAAPNLPATINPATAQLPRVYEAARAALAQCYDIDECQDWADKAQALASYARQADDQTLLNHAKRIQGRAVRRVGELLKQFDGRGRPAENKDVAVPISQSAAARDAHISERQAKTAVRIANIPEDQFESAIESDAPPTVTVLANAGRKPRAIIEPEPPPGFAVATQGMGWIRDLAEFCTANDPLFVAGGVLPREAGKVRKNISVIDAWLNRFASHIPEA